MDLLPGAKLLMYQALVERGLSLALFSDAAARDKYSTKGECVCPGYTAGGAQLKASAASDGLFVREDAVWPDSTITARSALIYERQSGKGVLFFRFPEMQRSERDEFRVGFDPERPVICL